MGATAGLKDVAIDDVVPAGHPWSGIVDAGAVLRIVDLEGRQGVDFLCYSADDPSERYHQPNTIKKAGTIALNAGVTLYSDRARALMTIVADTCGDHDTIGGCCSIPGNRMLYGAISERGCRENFLEALEPYGLGWRDIVPNVNFFCNVPVNPDRSLAPGVFAEGRSKPGDHVDLRADMRVIVAISNCPQVNNPCNAGEPTPIRILVASPA
jgi:hypothetical protein